MSATTVPGRCARPSASASRASPRGIERRQPHAHVLVEPHRRRRRLLHDRRARRHRRLRRRRPDPLQRHARSTSASTARSRRWARRNSMVVERDPVAGDDLCRDRLRRRRRRSRSACRPRWRRRNLTVALFPGLYARDARRHRSRCARSPRCSRSSRSCVSTPRRSSRAKGDVMIRTRTHRHAPGIRSRSSLARSSASARSTAPARPRSPRSRTRRSTSSPARSP